MQQPDQLILDAIRDTPEESQGSAVEATLHELLGCSRRPRSARGMPAYLRAEPVVKMSPLTTFWWRRTLFRERIFNGGVGLTVYPEGQVPNPE